MNDASTMLLRRYDVSRKRGSGDRQHYDVEFEIGYRCSILLKIPMIYSTTFHPRYMHDIIILRCLRLNVVSNSYLALLAFVMANLMSSIQNADPGGMKSMFASELCACRRQEASINQRSFR